MTIPTAGQLLGVSRVVAWKFAKRGQLGPVRVVNKRGRMEVSLAELMQRFPIPAERLKGIKND